MVIMVENTDANRTMCRILPEEGRRLAERFQGKRIVKCEALQVWAMSHTKDEPPKAEAQKNVKLTALPPDSDGGASGKESNGK